MKKLTTLLFLLFLSLNFSKAQGFNDYKRLIEHYSLYPYRLPDKNYSPATILRIVKGGFLGLTIVGEDLIVTKQTAFPHINYAKDNKFGSDDFKNISNTTISFGVNSNTNSILPGKLLLAVGFDLSNAKSVELTMTNPTIQEIQLYDIDTAIAKMTDKTILNELLIDRTFIVGKALQSTGYSYTFQRKTKMTIQTKDSLNLKIDTLGLKLVISPTDSTTYTLSSTDTLYYGYSPCEINSGVIKQRINDLESLNKLKDSIDYVQSRYARLNSENSNFDINQLTKQSTLLQESIIMDKAKGNQLSSHIGAMALTGNNLPLMALNQNIQTNTQKISTISKQIYQYTKNKANMVLLKARIELLKKQVDYIKSKKYSFVSYQEDVQKIESMYHFK